jgi:hypothetical protein
MNQPFSRVVALHRQDLESWDREIRTPVIVVRQDRFELQLSYYDAHKLARLLDAVTRKIDEARTWR